MGQCGKASDWHSLEVTEVLGYLGSGRREPI